VDLFSFGFVLLILGAGGVIAYLADKLGKKLGKKRLSLRVGRWSLRPRHVAELGTVVMGVLVALLTILFVAAASSDARAWLKEGRHLLRQRDELLRENEELRKDNKLRLRDSERLSTTNLDLEKKNLGLVGTNRELAKSLEAERGNLAQVQAQKQGLVAEAARLLADSKRLGGQNARLEKGIESTRVALRASQASLARDRKALKVASAELKGYQIKIANAQRDLEVGLKNLNVALKNQDDAYKKGLVLYKEVVRLQTEITELNMQMEALKAQQMQAEKDLATAQNQYATTQAQLVAATKQMLEIQDYMQFQQQFLSTNIRASRIEAMTYRAREEVARVTVPGGSSLDAARSALLSLLRKARVEASDRGAKGHRTKGQVFEVADVFDRQDPVSRTAVTADDLKNAVISRASGRVEDQVLIATSSYNAFTGEPVSLDIAVLSNPLIYHRGELLSEARIDGSEPEDRIFAQLSEFLRTRLQERAKDDGMIPRAGTEAKFGVVPVLDVLNLVRDVKKVGRAVRVQAFAGDDIRAAEPLRLEFHLR
jgi:uncharacterized protein (DUF3084 family)